MRIKNIYLYLLILGAHVCIAAVVFIKFLANPFHIIFSREGDGLKNTFTLISYVKEPVTADGILKYNSFNYPFGDYVYYADNMPLFAIPFRWFCQHVHDLSAYTLIIFNLFVISNIIISGLLVYYIFSRLLRERLFSFAMAIILPWTNMMVLRVFRGHYSLSFSSFVLLAIVLLMLWHKYREQLKKQALVMTGMVLLSVVSFLAHGYFLAIITLFIASMLFFYGLWNRKEKFGKITLYASVIYPILAVGLTMLILLATDKNLALRRSTAHGYDGIETKTRVFALFNHYNFQNVYFPISRDEDTSDADKAAYLGNIGLYALFILGIVAMINKTFRKRLLDIQKDIFRDPLKASIILGSVIMLFISFGEIYYTEDGRHAYGYRFVNIFNVFFYLHFITDKVEQFRCLERFIWPFFFGFNIWMIYTVVEVYKQSTKKIQIWIFVGLLFVGVAELKDYMVVVRHETNHGNYLSADSVALVKPGHLDARQYQAILPIPYYFVGSENYLMTLDDNDVWSRYTFMLQLNTGLPLMACKMSRVPPLYNRILTAFVAYGEMDARLRDKLNSKPILVAVNKKLITVKSPYNIPTGGNQERLYLNSLQFVSRNHLQAVDSAGDVIFYNYFPK